MGVGLPKPVCRGRLQTARCCCSLKRDHAGGVSPRSLSPHPMDHASKRALKRTNESTVSVFDPSAIRLIPQPCFLRNVPRHRRVTPLQSNQPAATGSTDPAPGSAVPSPARRTWRTGLRRTDRSCRRPATHSAAYRTDAPAILATPRSPPTTTLAHSVGFPPPSATL